MLPRLIKGAGYGLVLLRALGSRPQRDLLRRMMAFSRSLPAQFDRPLPAMMAHLTPSPDAATACRPAQVRRLADAIAAWHLRSPLGICLRRSLLRYYFLREAGLPVRILFGARLKSHPEGDGLGGHAWLTLHGEPYYENPHDYQGFVVMYTYPEAATNKSLD